MNEIDKKIKAYYNSKSLSKDQLNRITGKQKQIPPKPWKSLLKYAAVFFLVAACFFQYQKSSHKNNLLEKYAKEVAFNHHKNLASDIVTKNVEELNNKMSKLNFEIQFTEDINNKYSLIGGRYCSIDERMAAQLKIQNKKTNQIETLYVLDKIKNENFDNSFLIDSTSIQIWNSQSNLFVLASN